MSSSRRDSRLSLGNRQNDALFEFETFKRKFLLANKHITKLNSTLSIRIEELNAQMSMLYVENLRLRASEIALASQLKREREQWRKILVDAEAASQTLTKHLNHFRESLHTKGDAPLSPPSPKARRPPIIIDPTSPQFRIARPPSVPGIYEEEEPSNSSAEEREKSAIPARKKQKTSKLSASKLPIPARGSSPTPPSTGEPNRQRIDLSNVDITIKPRKTIRRQSGLLKVNTESLALPRSGSPAFGSPIRLEAALAEAKEEKEAVHGETRNALQPIDSNEEPIKSDTKSTTQRQFLRPPSPSRDASSPILERGDAANGREKRVRKSINYAEPKLNTKMRKPDPTPGSEPSRRKRSSVARTSTNKPSSSSSVAADTPHDAIVDADTGTAQSTLPLKGVDGKDIDPESFPIPPSRPGSAAAMYSPGPPSRTTGSTSSSQGTTTAPSSSSTSGTTEQRDHRPRPRLLSDDDSDGADADSEFGNGGHVSSSSLIAWSNVNVDSGRRRGPPKRSAATAAVAALEDIRRHSMVI